MKRTFIPPGSYLEQKLSAVMERAREREAAEKVAALPAVQKARVSEMAVGSAGVTRSRLLKRLRVTSAELDAILAEMIATGAVETYSVPGRTNTTRMIRSCTLDPAPDLSRKDWEGFGATHGKYSPDTANGHQNQVAGRE